MRRIKLFEEFELLRNNPVEVVVGILIRSKRGRYFLLHRSDGRQLWSMMTGGQDVTDMDDRATILHEMEEELMLKSGYNIKMEHIRDEEIKGKNRVLRYYIGHVDREFDVHLDHENLEWGWFNPNGDSIKNGSQHMWGLPSPLYPGIIEKITEFEQRKS